ncbi:MAG: NTP transferase domain-containing protein [Oscillospiraceae bacterium]|nr:NTP transferase domain-containing protein [Oscillospiraceae bacterium]
METAALIIQGWDEYPASEPVANTMPLLRLIRTFQYAGIKRIVVAGEDYIMNEAFNRATRLEAEFIHSTRTKRKFTNYRVNALTYLKDKCDNLLLTPANYPLFDIPTVAKMIESGASLAVPVFEGKRGYPILLSSELFKSVIAADGDYEKLLTGSDYVEVEVEDEGVTADVTGPINAEEIAKKLALHTISRPGFKLTIRRESSYYGPGAQEMIRLVEETGALKTAFSLMGISASHARSIIKETETGLGFRIFSSEKDNMRDGSVVTKEARDFAAKYKAFHEDCERYIEESYKRHFK